MSSILHPSPPLSPSAFINLAMLDGDGTTTTTTQTGSGSNINSLDSVAASTADSSMDFFKFYLDQQQKDQQSQAQQQLQQPSTLSLADIEQFQSFFNSINAQQQQQPVASTSSLQSPPQQQQQQPLFPFAEAAPTSLPPSAFTPASISHGSELPIDPSLFKNFFEQSHPVNAPAPAPVSASVSATSTASSSASTRSRKVSPSSSKGRKRAVAEMKVEEISDEERHLDEDLEEDDEEMDAEPASKSAKRSSGRSATKKASQPVQHPHALVPVPEWEDRLSKEEYDKLSSKEKRQMRNKISARNFRHRRKAHIDTLEAEIAQKDGVITVLREEVGTLRSENQDLRADIEVLKKNWESIAAKISAPLHVPPTPSTSASSVPHGLTPEEDDLYGSGSNSLPALSPGASSSASTAGDTESFFDNASSSASTSQRRISTRSQAKPNIRKDIGPSTGATIWDSPFGGFRGVDVHTTLVPEISLGSPASQQQDALSLAGKPSRDIPGLTNLQQPRQNMNPGLNNLTSDQLSLLRASLNLNPQSQQQRKQSSLDPTKDTFFESNPFLLLRHDNFQDYRGQLYSKLANNIAGIQNLQHASRSSSNNEEERQRAIAGFQPAYFAQQSPSHDSISSASFNGVSAKEVAVAGALVQKTLFEKLSGAFWDAFTGSSDANAVSTSKGMLANSSSSTKRLDAKKVADVIGGKGRLQVVSNNESESVGQKKEDELEGLMSKLEIVKK